MRLLAPLLITTALAAADPAPKVQIAILLDDSGSMSGLITQAKAHLWDVVNQLATTTRDGVRPEVEVALYHYGDVRFLAQPLIPLTRDLDAVSQQLNAINGGGGEERCGEVIMNATTQLAWSTDPRDLKMIVIAGNEPFTQGPVSWQDACKAAIAKGIMVNAVHCGIEAEGRQGGWDQAPRLADGNFLNIDHNKAVVAIQTPFDDDLMRLNTELNRTYLGYGAQAMEYRLRQDAADGAALAAAPQAAASRVAAKSSQAYENSAWDLVDLAKNRAEAVAALPEEELPEVLRGKDADARAAVIACYSASRAAVQTRIQAVSASRAAFVAAEEAKQAAASGTTTLGQALQQAIAEQARKKGYATGK
jgi:hypothetical protein